MEGKFSYPTATGTVSGYFNIYQGRSGAIFMLMGNRHVELTQKQIDELGLPLYELPDFNHDDYTEWYYHNN